MTPDVVVDIGNSRMKWGRCDSGRVVEMVSLPHDEAVSWKRQLQTWGLGDFARWAVVGVVPHQLNVFVDWLTSRGFEFTQITNEHIFQVWVPNYDFVSRVRAPMRIGIDRLLTALAAFRQSPPDAAVVAVSVGTAMTVDLVERGGKHVGGAILPGPQMMARALHEFTAQLPLLEIHPTPPIRLYGEDTEQAIELGVASAVLGAADLLVREWAGHTGQPPWVYVTGGAAALFHGFRFSAILAGFVIDPNLTLEGIRIAAEAMG